MKLSRALVLLAQLLATVSAQQWPLHDDGLNDVVQWDHYSLLVNGQRLFFWSGEFHYWRIPVPELWIDIMQKVRQSDFRLAKGGLLTVVLFGAVDQSGGLQCLFHLYALGLAQRGGR